MHAQYRQPTISINQSLMINRTPNPLSSSLLVALCVVCILLLYIFLSRLFSFFVFVFTTAYQILDPSFSLRFPPILIAPRSAAAANSAPGGGNARTCILAVFAASIHASLLIFREMTRFFRRRCVQGRKNFFGLGLLNHIALIPPL